MNFPFDNEVLKILLNAAADDADEPLKDDSDNFIEQKVLDYLDGLKPGKRIASSPLVKVIETTDITITFLIRGRIRLLKNAVNPFVRMEARLLKTQLGLDEVTTFVAELHILEPKSTPVTEVRMGLGYDGLTFMGRGAARLKPIGFGLDIFLGGVSDRGIMLGIGVYLPAPVPLGPIPFGLNGLAGEYAHNFKPRIESGLEAEGPKVDLSSGETPAEEVPDLIGNPNALQYVQWARNPDEALDRWVAAPPNETAIGIGIKASFCDVPSVGNLLILEDVGFAVFTPGPVIILGGEGHLISAEKIIFEAYTAIDIDSSFSLGGGVSAEFPSFAEVISFEGTFDSFFSWQDPRSWFFRLGEELDPAVAKFLVEYKAKLYLELNHYQVACGMEIIWLSGFKLKKIFEVFVQLSAKFRALIGWNPKQIAAEIGAAGEAGIKILKFKIAASISFRVLAHFPKPKFFKARTQIKINLPWPVPDTTLTFTVPREENAIGPDVEIPYMPDINQSVRIGAIHEMTGRQWDLSLPNENNVNQPWPDSNLVIQFSDQLIDNTGIIGNPNPGPESKNQGGYLVQHTLDLIEIIEIETGEPVAELQAHWAAASGTDTAQLHLLAQDPYSWLSSQESVISSLGPAEAKSTLQTFGIGESISFVGERQFSEMYITPQNKALLSQKFNIFLPSRTITTEAMTLAFRLPHGPEIPVDKLYFVVLENRQFIDSSASLQTLAELPLDMIAILHQNLAPNLYLVTYEVLLPGDFAINQVQISSLDGLPFHLFAVLYQKTLLPTEHCQNKVILEPRSYRLSMSGTTTATSQHEQPNPEPRTWDMQQDFKVISPPSLRPYLKTTTVGDSRMFGDDPDLWNPTLYGIGFPAYRQYLPVFRCNVPYISRLFSELIFQLTYDEDSAPALEFSITPMANPNGDNSLLEVSKNYREWSGCNVPADEEFIAPELPKVGSAKICLLSQGPQGETQEIDNWSCYVSLFQNFKEHVTLSQQRLKRIYTAAGPQTLPNCFTPGFGFTSARSIGGGRIDTIQLEIPPPVNTSPPFDNELPISDGPVFPDELDTPPLDWRMPNELRNIVNDTKINKAIMFSRFALASDVAFFEDLSNPLFGINNTVESTTIEGLVDTSQRLYALWLRTPEPIDWRRVNASLSIRHFDGDDICDKDFAFRKKLALNIEIIPSPDGSSAFLVGRLNNILIRLPRGAYKLLLSFDPTIDTLEDLRQGPSINPKGKEVTTLTFLQQSGENWPLPNENLVLTHFAMARLISLGNLPDDAIDRILALNPEDRAAVDNFNENQELLFSNTSARAGVENSVDGNMHRELLKRSVVFPKIKSVLGPPRQTSTDKKQAENN